MIVAVLVTIALRIYQFTEHAIVFFSTKHFATIDAKIVIATIVATYSDKS